MLWAGEKGPWSSFENDSEVHSRSPSRQNRMSVVLSSTDRVMPNGMQSGEVGRVEGANPEKNDDAFATGGVGFLLVQIC